MKKRNKNKLYTISYFRKRLADSGVSSVRLINRYGLGDKRYWTILIEPQKANILCTCYKDQIDSCHFVLSTSNVPNFRVDTKSMEIMIDVLKDLTTPVGGNEPVGAPSATFKVEDSKIS